MASTRELYLVLRGRDEASRVVSGFARNVRSAGLAARAAQLEARSAAIRQQAQMLQTNSAIAKQIDVINRDTIALDRQARHFSLAAAQARQYRDSLKAIGATDSEIDAASNAVRNLQHQAAIFARQASINRNIMSGLRQDLHEQVTALNSQAHALDQQSKRLRIASADARNHEIAMAKLKVGLRATGDAALSLGVAFAAAGAGGAIMLANFVKTAAEYERQVHMTRTQVDGMKYSVQQLGDVGRRTAREIGVRFEEIQPALFDIFSSMEVGIGDAERLLKAFSKGAVAGQTDIQAVSRATIGLMNAFKLPASEVNRILDLQFELVQEGIGTYEEWNQRIGLVTPSAVRAGQSIEMMVAALAASTRFGISAARSGTAVARAFDAMSHPKAVKQMELLGIKVRDAHGRMRPLNLVLREFRDVLMKMPEKDRLAAILDVFKGAGGTIEARRFLQNILLGKNGLETFDMILEQTRKSAGNMENAYKTMADTTANRTELLRNQWMLLKEGIGSALLPAVNDFMSALTRLMDHFNNLSPGTKKLIADFLVWGTVIASVVGAILLVVGVIATFITVVASAGSALLIAGGLISGFILSLGLLAGAFIYAYKKSDEFKMLIAGMKDTLERIGAIFKDTATKIKESWDTTVAPALEDLKQILEEDVMPAVNDFRSEVADKLIPALQEMSDIITYVTDVVFVKFSEFIKNDLGPTLKELSKIYNENKKEIHFLIGAFLQAAVVGTFLIAVLGASGLTATFKILGAAMRMSALAIAFWIQYVRAMIVIVKGAWEWIKRLIDRIVEFGRSSPLAIQAVMNKFNALRALVASVVANVVARFAQLRSSIVSAATAAVNAVVAQFNRMRTNIGSAISAAIGLVRNFRSAVISTFAGAGSWLVNAGRNLVLGFANGIRGAIGAAASAAARVAAAAKNAAMSALKIGSPSKVFHNIGLNTMLGFIRGVVAMEPMVKRSIQDALGTMNSQVQANRFGPALASAHVPVGFTERPDRTSKVINQTIHVTTNEVDPRYNAQQLGFELLSRM